MRQKHGINRILALAAVTALSFMLGSCNSVAVIDGKAVSLEELAASVEDMDEFRAQITVAEPEATGKLAFEGDGAVVDASNAGLGYVMIKRASPTKRQKVRVTFNNDVIYDYDLAGDGQYAVYPLQSGSGAYNVRVLEQVEGDTYAVVHACEFTADMASENSPFLYPNVYVDYDKNSESVLASQLICKDAPDDMEKAERLFGYVAYNTQYDTDKADNIRRGYIPDVDVTLRTQKGICFDYASLLAAMLRAQGIPARLVMGQASPENVLHAWNQAYINGNWVHMDPTFHDGRGPENYTVERIY